MILQTRDIEILRFIAKFGYVNSLHISKMFILSKPRTSQIVQRLIKSEYIKKDNIFTNEPNIFTLLTAGAKLIKSNRVKKITLQNLRHNLLLVDVYINLKLKNPELEILSDRELRSGRGFGAKGHVPDMEIITPVENGKKNIAIELELSRKSIKRVKPILFLLKRKYIETHYYCDDSVYDHINRLVLGYQSVKVFSYFKLEQFPEVAELVQNVENKVSEELKEIKIKNNILDNEKISLNKQLEKLHKDIQKLKEHFSEVDFKKSAFGSNYSLGLEELIKLEQLISII
jgi:DNA-binding MarR family transcriptional regulator